MRDRAILAGLLFALVGPFGFADPDSDPWFVPTDTNTAFVELMSARIEVDAVLFRLRRIKEMQCIDPVHVRDRNRVLNYATRVARGFVRVANYYDDDDATRFHNLKTDVEYIDKMPICGNSGTQSNQTPAP